MIILSGATVSAGEVSKRKAFLTPHLARRPLSRRRQEGRKEGIRPDSQPRSRLSPVKPAQSTGGRTASSNETLVESAVFSGQPDVVDGGTLWPRSGYGRWLNKKDRLSVHDGVGGLARALPRPPVGVGQPLSRTGRATRQEGERRGDDGHQRKVRPRHHTHLVYFCHSLTLAGRL